jgi:hypothetical protein
LDALPVQYLLAIRFTTGAVLLGLLCWKKWRIFTPDYLWRGAVIGGFLYLAYSVQTYGLALTTPSKNAFLTAVYCVLTGKAEFVSLPMCLLTFAVGVVIITVQYIFFYLVGESKGAQLLSLVRMLPSMCFFFVSMKVIGEIQKNPAEAFALLEKVGGNLDAIGWGGAVMALIVMMAGIVFCTRATAKKDY